LKIGVIGTGYVGLIQAVGLASFDHKVIGVDIDTLKIEKLKRGISPLHKEGLEEVLKKHVNKNLIFFINYKLKQNKNTDVNIVLSYKYGSFLPKILMETNTFDIKGRLNVKKKNLYLLKKLKVFYVNRFPKKYILVFSYNF